MRKKTASPVTKTPLYIRSGRTKYSLDTILKIAEDKWPGIRPDEIDITAVYLAVCPVGPPYPDPDGDHRIMLEACEKYFKRMARKK